VLIFGPRQGFENGRPRVFVLLGAFVESLNSALLHNGQGGNRLWWYYCMSRQKNAQVTAAHSRTCSRKTLQHIAGYVQCARHCNTLQNIAPNRTTPQHGSTIWAEERARKMLQRTAALCTILHNTAQHCNMAVLDAPKKECVHALEDEFAVLDTCVEV